LGFRAGLYAMDEGRVPAPYRKSNFRRPGSIISPTPTCIVSDVKRNKNNISITVTSREGLERREREMKVNVGEVRRLYWRAHWHV
jgi:hypothetical protein